MEAVMSRCAFSIFPLCLALGAGCSSQTDALVDYQVSGGFSGSGDGTSLTLDTRGVGSRVTAHSGTVPVQLDPAALADLHAKIRDAQFATLQSTYGCHGCADQLVYDIAVQADGHHYEVSIDESDTITYPEGLHALLVTLKQLAPP
jgi:hypothetical protein